VGTASVDVILLPVNPSVLCQFAVSRASAVTQRVQRDEEHAGSSLKKRERLPLGHDERRIARPEFSRPEDRGPRFGPAIDQSRLAGVRIVTRSANVRPVCRESHGGIAQSEDGCDSNQGSSTRFSSAEMVATRHDSIPRRTKLSVCPRGWVQGTPLRPAISVAASLIDRNR